MKIKECFVSKHGISCFTDINTLVSIKKLLFKEQLQNIIIKKNLLTYIVLRSIEFIIHDFIANRHYLRDNDQNDEILTSFIFS
tara:strand:+ start:439 stop:687 length:249 start_codon:yes stop_codon:yes gene_type:complete